MYLYIKYFTSSYCSNGKKVCRGDPKCGGGGDWKTRGCSDYLNWWKAQRGWSDSWEAPAEPRLVANPSNCRGYVECAIKRESTRTGFSFTVTIRGRLCPGDQMFSAARRQCDLPQNVVAERSECRGDH